MRHEKREYGANKVDSLLLRVSPEFKESLKERARQRGLSVSEYVRKVLQEQEQIAS